MGTNAGLRKPELKFPDLSLWRVQSLENQLKADQLERPGRPFKGSQHAAYFGRDFFALIADRLIFEEKNVAQMESQAEDGIFDWFTRALQLN